MRRVYVGISGYNYAHWRNLFYPPGLPVRRWLEYASRQFNSIELNGTFYSLKSPAVFRRWGRETPDNGSIFAVKGSRFITHNLKLSSATTALANFYASGILALGLRHPSFFTREFYDQLEFHGCALVIADTAGRYPCVEELTADFVYVRLHGSQALYASEYTRSELAEWGGRVRCWASAGRDVYVYFDNDARAYAPHNAEALARWLNASD
jgi:uncharacterized protein YecE (DUF72 family)